MKIVNCKVFSLNQLLRNALVISSTEELFIVHDWVSSLCNLVYNVKNSFGGKLSMLHVEEAYLLMFSNLNYALIKKGAVTVDPKSVQHNIDKSIILDWLDKDNIDNRAICLDSNFISLCQNQEGKVFYNKDTIFYNHSKLLLEHNLTVDTINKYYYYAKRHHEHTKHCAYGIQGLQTSVVYQYGITPPFEPKLTHLKRIEEAIEKIEKALI